MDKNYAAFIYLNATIFLPVLLKNLMAISLENSKDFEK